MNLLNKILENQINEKDDIRYVSYYDELKRDLIFKKKFKVRSEHYNVFEYLIKWNLKKIDDINNLEVGQHFIIKNNNKKKSKYELIEYNFNSNFALYTKLDDIKYWIIYELKIIKPSVTKVRYIQKIKLPVAIFGYTRILTRRKYKILIDEHINLLISNIIKEKSKENK